MVVVIANSEGLSEPANPRSLARAFAVRKNNVGLDEASDKEPHRWSFWVAVHVCLKDLKVHSLNVPFLRRRPNHFVSKKSVSNS